MSATKRATGLVAKKGIELLTAGTPNGFKVSILLEELKQAYGIDYTYQNIDIFGDNVQKEPWFTKLGPNGRIPVIVDHDHGGYAAMESLAIINYLTRRFDLDHKFTFTDPQSQCDAEQWMAWQQGGLGPMQAQANFYYRFCPDRHAFPTQKFFGETERLYGVLEARLAQRDYLAGPGRGLYSTADMMVWPFIHTSAVTGIHLEKFRNLYEWWGRIEERPAVKKALMVPTGVEFQYGYRTVQMMRKDNPEAAAEMERPFKEALEKAQKEFGYVYQSP